MIYFQRRFAVVKQACKRLVGTTAKVKGHELTWNMIPYDVQLLGGIILHQGKIAEMKTGGRKNARCGCSGVFECTCWERSACGNGQ